MSDVGMGDVGMGDATVVDGMMRAAVCSTFGGPEQVRVERIPTPVHGDGDVLVRVHAASVSVADRRARSRDVPRGLGVVVGPMLGWRSPKHQVLGMDAVGVVVAVGSAVEGYAQGDRVVLLRGAAFGCHAEYVTRRAVGALAHVPDDVSFADAAAIPFGFGTAEGFLRRAGSLQGRSVLVIGGAGAVGSAAIQLAATAGAEVTAVTSAGNAALVRSLGASAVIDYAVEDFTERTTSFDVIIDCVGSTSRRRMRRCVRSGGSLLLVVTDLAGLVSTRLRPTRAGVRTVTDGEPVTAAMLAELVRRVADGELVPLIDSTYDLDEIRAAHARVDTGRKRGAVLVLTEPQPIV